MSVTCDLEHNERMGWSTYKIRVRGLDVCGITDLTDKSSVDRFVELANACETELFKLVTDANERREWNMAHIGQGKDWPAFKAKDNKISALLREAGIRNS